MPDTDTRNNHSLTRLAMLVSPSHMRRFFIHYFIYILFIIFEAKGEWHMKTNEGTVDRIARGIAGAAAVGVALVLGGTWWILGAVGVVLIVTAATGFCGLYTLFGISTCPVKRSE